MNKPRKIRIINNSIGVVEAILLEELNPMTVNKIWNELPLEGRTNLWGEEIYFPIPVKMNLENSQEIVEIGDLGYWPPGHSFCIFFGLTPISSTHVDRDGKNVTEIRPANPVNVFGRIIGDPTILRRIEDGERIIIEKSSS